MDQSSFPKQSRADQDSRSDVDQDLPVDQTRKEDNESGDSCGSGRGGFNHRPKLTLKDEMDDVDDPSGKYYYYAAKNKKSEQKNIMKRICCSIGSYFCIFNGKEEPNGIGSKRLRSFPGQSSVPKPKIAGDESWESDVDESWKSDVDESDDYKGERKGCTFIGDYGRDQDSSKNDFFKIKTFQLRGGDDGCSGSTVADQGQGGSATTGSSGGAYIN